MTENKLPYIVDTSKWRSYVAAKQIVYRFFSAIPFMATRVSVFSWRDNILSVRVLSPGIRKKNKFLCHGLAVAEASRGIIALRSRHDIPELSAMEAVNYCRVDFSKGQYSTALGLEWIVREGLAEDTDTSTRHIINEWEPLPETEPAIKCAAIRQPVIVSLECASSLFENYEGGLIDPHEMQTSETCYAHTMLLIGYGFYLYPDKSFVQFWELKNHFGEKSAKNEYIDIKRNSSLVVDKWVRLNPLVPLRYLPHIVEDMPFKELGEIWWNLYFHIIILFYDERCMDKIKVSKDFERSSRFYLTKGDVRFVRVDATNKWDECSRYGVSYQGTPVLRIYNCEEKSGSKTRERSRDDGFVLTLPKIDFQTMISFLFEKLNGSLV